jgi:hypothetical protein
MWSPSHMRYVEWAHRTAPIINQIPQYDKKRGGYNVDYPLESKLLKGDTGSFKKNRLQRQTQ